MSLSINSPIQYKVKYDQCIKLSSLILILLISPQIALAMAQDSSSKGISLLEAVETTIKNHALIQLQKEQVKINQGQLQSASGLFDWRLQSVLGASQEHTPPLQMQKINGFSKLTTNQSYYNLEIGKQFRSGLSISSGINVTREEDNLNNKTVPNYARVNFVTKVPLLRGRGRAATGANELASEILCEAAILELNYTISQAVFHTMVKYWNYVTAKQKLDITRESELRAAKLVNETEILIRADERPQADIQQLQANLADKIASRIAAEQDLFQAQQELGLAMGIKQDDIMHLPLPSDDFSMVSDTTFSDRIDQYVFLEQSLKRRADLRAAKNKVTVAQVLLNAAINQEKPQLNFQLEAGYIGLDEGDRINYYFTPFKRNFSGLNFGCSMVWEVPTGVYHGLAAQRNSEYQQTLIQSDELSRNIISGVMTALNDLKSSAQRLKKSEEAIALYQTTIENEKMKLQQGISTLIDLMLFEDRLTSALLNKIAAQFNYAIAIARLRFETGILIQAHDNGVQFNLEDIPDRLLEEDQNQ